LEVVKVKTKRKSRLFLTLILAFFLAACSNSEQENEQAIVNERTKTENSSSEGHSSGHEGMNHSGSREVPEELRVAENPTFEVGSQAVITSDHMEGMKDAEATIVGAFDTIVYTISYTPADGVERVTNHKWIIHEEIKDASDQPYQPGDEVTVEANHMEGMENVTAEIDSAEPTTVYIVDFTTTSGEKVINHKWVTESELSAK